MPTKILVTGGTGFLGAYIIKDLIEKGYAVRALRRSSKLPGFIAADIMARVEWVDGDILDVISLEEAMEGIDHVIHSAAIVSFHARDRREMYQVNVDGTANVVNIALEKNIRRLVHISSVAAVGRTADGSPVDETKKWEESKLNTHYARSKHRAELEVWRAIGEGLDAVILNPSTILGYGEWMNGSSSIFRNIYEGFPWYTSGLNGFVDVKDVARATVLMLESNISEQRYIVSGETWPFKKLQDEIASCFNKKKPYRRATPALLSFAWRMEKLKSRFTGKKPLLTRESARVGISKTHFENKKILNALPGFKFTPLEETVKDACTKYAALQNDK